MTSYEFVVPVDPPDNTGRLQAQQQYQQSGWDVTEASPSSDDDSRLLFYKAFNSVGDGLAELNRIDDGGAATHAIWYRPDLVNPQWDWRFSPYARIPGGITVTNLATTSDAAADVGQVLRDVARVAGVPADAADSGPPPSGPPPSGPSHPPAHDHGVASSADGEVLPPADAQIKIIEMYWGGLDEDLKKQVAEQYFRSERERDKARSGSAAWRAASDWVLLNTSDKFDLYGQGRLATAMLQSRYGLLTQQRQADMEQTRVEIAKAGVATAVSLRKGIDQWRALAKAAPWFMGAALMISVGILVGAFLLVKWGRLNGYEFSLAIFICALFVVSPATLLLLERPLRGIDDASLSGKPPDDANGKSGSDTASPKTAKSAD